MGWFPFPSAWMAQMVDTSLPDMKDMGSPPDCGFLL